MLIDLNEILSETGKRKEVKANIEMLEYDAGYAVYPFVGDKHIEFVFVNAGKKIINFESRIQATLSIPCDRCLKPVEVLIDISVSRDIDLKKTIEEREKELDEMQFLQGMNFDTEAFIQNEILVNLPMKVLCNDDCKGICNRCGANLNNGSCDCDTTELDPRMSKILDVFNQFKEV